MPVTFLDPAALHPMRFADGSINRGLVHLARAIDHPNIDVGDFTYASSFDPPEDWATRLAPYTYAGAPERLVIGRYCQIADRVRIITASANHAMTGISTYPFAIFDHDLFTVCMSGQGALPDTVIGHDVWIGDGATILPGARIGNGVIIGAAATVSGMVPDYAVVAGNPARVLRMRFDGSAITRLSALGWWDWPVEQVRAAIPALAASDIDMLASFAP